MLPYRDIRLTQIVLGIFFVIVVLYAYYEARGLIYGPAISIPSNLPVSHSPFITLRGKAERISLLTMNGKALSVTEDGVFEEPYLLAPGYNRIVLRAQDKYGRTRESIVGIVYQPVSSSTSASVSTSTPSTASSTLKK